MARRAHAIQDEKAQESCLFGVIHISLNAWAPQVVHPLLSAKSVTPAGLYSNPGGS
jgi:hypothetical protein